MWRKRQKEKRKLLKTSFLVKGICNRLFLAVKELAEIILVKGSVPILFAEYWKYTVWKIYEGNRENCYILELSDCLGENFLLKLIRLKEVHRTFLKVLFVPLRKKYAKICKLYGRMFAYMMSHLKRELLYRFNNSRESFEESIFDILPERKLTFFCHSLRLHFGSVLTLGSERISGKKFAVVRKALKFNGFLHFVDHIAKFFPLWGVA